MRKHLTRVLGTSLCIASVVYFSISLARYWQQASEVLQPALIGNASVAVTGVSLGVLLSALAWQRICRALGVPMGTLPALKMYFVAQFGKYLPGNVAQHAGRLALATRQGFPAARILLSQVVEIAMILGVACIIALVTGKAELFAMASQWRNMHPAASWTIVLAIVAVAILVTWFAAARGYHRRLFAISSALASRRGVISIFLAILLMGANFAVVVIALHVVVLGVAGPAAPGILLTACAYSVSWIIGTVAPGAPAGLGIREAIMLNILETAMPPGQSAAVAVIFRIVTTISDLLIFGIGLLIKSEKPKVSKPSAPGRRATDGKGDTFS